MGSKIIWLKSSDKIFLGKLLIGQVCKHIDPQVVGSLRVNIVKFDLYKIVFENLESVDILLMLKRDSMGWFPSLVIIIERILAYISILGEDTGLNGGKGNNGCNKYADSVFGCH